MSFVLYYGYFVKYSTYIILFKIEINNGLVSAHDWPLIYLVSVRLKSQVFTLYSIEALTPLTQSRPFVHWCFKLHTYSLCLSASTSHRNEYSFSCLSCWAFSPNITLIGGVWRQNKCVHYYFDSLVSSPAQFGAAWLLPALIESFPST